MRTRFWLPAAPGERFAPHSWDRIVGTLTDFKFGGQKIGIVRVIAAEVAEDGSGVSITYEPAQEAEEDPVRELRRELGEEHQRLNLEVHGGGAP